MVQANVIAMSGKAVEAAGDVDVLLLDKTGTITLGNRQATAFFPADGVTIRRWPMRPNLSSLADETPEGRSIVILAKENYGSARARHSRVEAHIHSLYGSNQHERRRFERTGNSQGAADAIEAYVTQLGGHFSQAVRHRWRQSPSRRHTAGRGGGRRVLGVIHLKDIVKGGIKERFAELRRMGIKTVMITGDNPQTAAAIAAEAGVDDFLAQATPEAKLKLIRRCKPAAGSSR